MSQSSVTMYERPPVTIYSMTRALCAVASKSVPCEAALCACAIDRGAVGRPMLDVRFVFMVADDQMDAELLE